jgi:hypothetical protein
VIRFSWTAILRLAACSLFLCASTRAQIPATRLEGIIQNASGNPVSAAVITATDDKTGWRAEVQSDPAGRYVFPALPPGSYTVSVEAKGFRPAAHTYVLLGVSSSIEERFILERGGPTEAAKEEALRERVRSGESEISGAVPRRALENLPLLDRNPIALAAFQPGVQIRGGDAGSSRVNGTGQGSNNLTLDGVNVNDPVDPRLGLSMTALSADSIEQFRVVANGGSAEYGRNAGAQVMLITRSGGNRWSGSAFDYFRNKALNANDFFNNAANLRNPPFTQNFYGGTLGGPAISDRTFIFGNYQGRRTSQEIVRNRLVLTPAAKSGLFQWIQPGSSTVRSFDIAQNDPRKLGIDPKVRAVLAQLPDPNNSTIGDGLNTGGFQFKNPNDSNEDQLTIRADHKLTDNHHLFVRYSWARSSAVDSMSAADATYPGQPSGIDSERHWGLSAGSDWSISPRMANQARVGYQSAKINLERPARVAGPMLLSNSWSNPLDPSFAQWHNSPVTEVTDNLTLIRGNHSFKAGFTYNYTLQKSHNEAGIYPNVTFGRGYGNLPPSSVGPSGSAISQTDRKTFENLYNDLLGRIEQVTQTFYGNLQTFLPSGTPRTRDLLFHEYGAFLQDDWKLQPNFTLNLGIRYELSSAPSESNGIIGALDKADGVSSTANIANFTLQPRGEWYKKDITDFAPRVGFAWAPRNSTKMVIRGGYGFFFDRLVGATTNFVDNNTPVSSQVGSLFPNAGGADRRLSDGIPLPPQPAAPVLTLPSTRSTSVAIFKSDLRTPYVRHFNLTVQRQILRNTVVEAGYVGERGVRLFTNLNLNQLKIQGDFLQAFSQIQAFRSNGTPVPSTNTLVKILGSVNGAISAIGGSILDQGQAGLAADTIDRNYFGRYAAAGVSDFYLRNFPQFNQFIVGTTDGRSSYDSLQVSVRHDSRQLKVSANYTRSKSLDNLSAGCSGCTIPLDSFNLNLNKAPSDGDRLHVLNSWLVWALPIGKNRQFLPDASPFVNGILGGWDMGVLTVWETGPRFSVSSGLQTAGSGIASLANYTGSRQIGAILRESSGVYWFSVDQTKAFTLPVAGVTGTSGRNSFVGPGYFNLDVSLVKSVRVRGERRVSLRIEVYNVLNHTHFGLPDANLSNSTFSQISSTVGYPRQIQAALRYEF